MHRRVRRCAAGAALLAASPFGVAPAHAWVTNDVNNITLTQNFATLPSGWQLVTDGSAQFRWLDAPGKATTISGNSCGDLVEWGRINYPAGDTTWSTLFSNRSNCFQIRGKTQPGEGSMANPHDGRVRR